MFEPLTPPLTRTPVTVAWQRLSAVAEWSGYARSEGGPIVALSLTRHRDTVAWHKTVHRQRSSEDGTALPMSFWHSDPATVENAVLLNVQLKLPGILRCDTLRAESSAPVEVEPAWHGVTGEFAWLASRGGSVVGVLFVDRRDVSFGRNGAWHLRPALTQALRAPWRDVLAGPRRGTFDLPAARQ
jgi:hypothetical protein